MTDHIKAFAAVLASKHSSGDVLAGLLFLVIMIAVVGLLFLALDLLRKRSEKRRSLKYKKAQEEKAQMIKEQRIRDEKKLYEEMKSQGLIDGDYYEGCTTEYKGRVVPPNTEARMIDGEEVFVKIAPHDPEPVSGRIVPSNTAYKPAKKPKRNKPEKKHKRDKASKEPQRDQPAKAPEINKPAKAPKRSEKLVLYSEGAHGTQIMISADDGRFFLEVFNDGFPNRMASAGFKEPIPQSLIKSFSSADSFYSWVERNLDWARGTDFSRPDSKTLKDFFDRNS